MNTIPFVIGIPAYDGVDLFDVTAPVEVFSWMAEAIAKTRRVELHVLGPSKAAVRTRAGVPIVPHRAYDDVKHLDLLWVPGGDPPVLRRLMTDRRFLDHLRAWSARAEYVTSVCEGALLLAAAGLLDGHRATTHWAFVPCLERFDKITVIGEAAGWPRFVVDPDDAPPGTKGIRVTGGGISAALDEALELVRRIAGDGVATGVQISMQYMPDPPVHGTLPKPTSCPLDAIAGAAV